MYYALTQQWHFVEGECGLWASILSGEPVPILERRSDINPSLASIVDQALSNSPQDRPGSAEEMWRALEAITM